MAALQIEVSGVAQNVARLISVDSPITAPTTLSSNTNFISNITNLVTVDNPISSPTSVLLNGNKFFENNITNLIIIEGLGTSASVGGGSSESVSKESWE